MTLREPKTEVQREIRAMLIRMFEDWLSEAERGILAGVPGAADRACRHRGHLDRLRGIEEPPKPEITPAEYFAKYGMAAAGRA